MKYENSEIGKKVLTDGLDLSKQLLREIIRVAGIIRSVDII